ncbi:UNVERIFIED_CONTAM: hypothetical protein PYX00_000138 [Menopon gallinae]|uniref:Cap-specific mRNA (nucleoside-2'-O-)-methyltransferase 1 n=1 Tax=Menopon gallinae TaxID=328185 RepID=A0AAW2I8N7_9NEOP
MSNCSESYRQSDYEQMCSYGGDDGNEQDGESSENYESNENEEEYQESLPNKRARFDNYSDYQFGKHSINENDNTNESKPCSSQGKAARIMAKSGYQPGKGLGKHGQGIVEPVKASEQKGRSGFGFVPRDYKDEITIDPEKEKISVFEQAFWLENRYSEDDILSTEQLKDWLKIGPEKLNIDDEVHFCNPTVLHDVLEAKFELGNVNDVTKIRGRCNPFETIGKGIFLNRAAMKMANMNRVFDFMFTDPKDKEGKNIVQEQDLLYFADVCAGPGGFSEYIFYKKKWRAKGFGFTLANENDFELEKFFAGPSETFEPHYGFVPQDAERGDGDIFKAENIESFSSFVLANTDGEGVHLMMADGGFQVNEKSIQEIVSKQLYLCQCLVALRIIRTNGNFVVKLFDIFTPFSVGLIYLMYRCFDRISIHKPNSSRPGNSERYLICQYKKENCTDLIDHLMKVNEILCKRFETKKDVLELVPLDVLKGDETFFEYIYESNNRIGERQVHHLKNIVIYANRTDLVDSRQEKFQRECLEYWDIPNEARTDPNKGEPHSKIRELFSNRTSEIDSLNTKPKKIPNFGALKEEIKSELNWYWEVVGNGDNDGKLSLYLGLGRNNVYRLENQRWNKVKDNSNFKLPGGTLVYGELVDEYVVNSNNIRAQYRRTAFHIVDGLFLGGEDIRRKQITDRIKLCSLFAKALRKSNMIYRAKKLYNFTEMPRVLPAALQRRKLKSNKNVIGFVIDKDQFIVPEGILCFCGTSEGWCLYKSKQHVGHLYYYNRSDESTVWQNEASERYEKAARPWNSFRECYEKRLALWIDDRTLNDLLESYPSQ